MAREFVQVTIDPQGWYDFAARLDTFEGKLKTQLRRRIKEAGQLAVDAIRVKLAEPSPADGPDTGEGRRALAAATSIAVSFTKTGAGVRVVTSSRRLSPEHVALLKTYNLKESRHPLFGNRNVWIRQKGRPYFGAAIAPEMRKELAGKMRLALADAAEKIGSRGR
jgi:hypothetical protein